MKNLRRFQDFLYSIQEQIMYSRLFSCENIDDSRLSSEFICEFSFEHESELFHHFFSIFFLLITRHLVENYPPLWSKKWECPTENIRDVRCCPRDNEVILSCVFWILSQNLCSFLERFDIRKTKFSSKVTHSFYLFSNTIEECDMEFWHDYFKRNPWESSSRTDIKETKLSSLHGRNRTNHRCSIE